MTATNVPRPHGREWMLPLAMGSLLSAALLVPIQALAQRATATIVVNLSRGEAAAPAGTGVVALNTENGTTTEATPRVDGSQVLTGLQPGEYLVTVTPPGGLEVYRLARVQVGQTVKLNIDLAGEAVAEGGTLLGETTIVEGRLTESLSSEVATNVSREQIDSLPQVNRNFLNFAELAPSVRVSHAERRKEVTSGALESRSTNVFVDGVSLKSNILPGGIVGQDASRGNPFPQLAVGGFRVISQNYKAEYEQAGAAVISAITRSGGNEFHGELFGTFQDETFIARDYFALQRGDPRPDIARYQAGAALGGPLLKDKLHFFLTYEANIRDELNQVAVGVPTPENLERFGQYEGSFNSPFREHLGFGKLTWRPSESHNLDLSISLRRETDIRGFGRTTSIENAENVRNNVLTASAKHQWWLGRILNEANLQILSLQWNPTVLNPDEPGFLYQPNVIKIGGRSTTQDVRQIGYTLRDDVSFPALDWRGQHFFKTGLQVSFQNYAVTNDQFGNPEYRFREDPRNDLSFEFPFEAEYGVGDPSLKSDNTQFGVYVQDDWQIGERLTLNLGVRWDVENNPLNNDYETPADVRAAMTELAATVAAINGPDHFPVENYLTDGTQRPPFLGAIQPRLGVTYDLLGNQSTILFAAAGRYYDRALFGYGQGERLRLQHERRTFRFSRDGTPRDNQSTIAWRDEYLSEQGLQTLIEQGVAPPPEVVLLENDTKPPRSDQFSAGVRQHLGPVNATLTFTHVRTDHDLGFYWANRDAGGNRAFIDVPGRFGNVLISDDDHRMYRYTGVQLAVEKPFSRQLSGPRFRWGMTVAYTLAWARQRGERFNLFEPTIADIALYPTANDERHRLVVSGIAGLPWDFKLSTLLKLGSGLPYEFRDQTTGIGPANGEILLRNGRRAPGFIQFKQLDLRLEKEFQFAQRHRGGIFIDVFNVFNWRNFGGYNGTILPATRPPNPNFDKPSILIGPTRTFQGGVSYKF